VRYQSVNVRYPQAQDLSELNYGLGSAAFYLGRHQLAWDTLKQVSDEALPPAERVNLKLMLAELARLRENYWLAWLKLKSAFDDLRQTDHLQTIKTVDEVRELIKDLITDKLIPDQLLAIKENYPKNFPGGEALLRLAQLAKEALDYGRAQTLLDEFFTDFPAHPDYKTAQELKQKIEQTLAVDKNKLGLIVPLSGRFSVYGDMVLKGVELAIEEINRERENKFSLIIKDSQENPAQAAKSFETLVIEDRVIGIIGPVLSNSARIAAEVANRLLTPMITPTASAKGIPELGPYVFRNCITSTQQAQAITKFAIENMCLDEFAVLYPNNPYGIEFKDIFCSYVDQLGGKILGVMAYTEEETDFRQQAEYLSNLEPEAIFIPDYADKVVLIAPQLAFYAKEQTKEDLPEDVVLDEGESKQEKNYQQTLLEDKLKKETASEWWMETGKVDALPPTILPQRISPLAAEAAETEASIHPLDTSRIILLGTNEWYAPQLVKEGGDFVEHAVFPTGFYYDSPTPAIVEFISRFKERFWQAPNLLAAQAYDAARMLILAIDKGATDRESLRQNLLNLKDIPAISGQTSFTPEGDTDKTLFMIGINHNRLRQLKGDEEWLCYNPDKLKRKKRLEIIHNQPEGGENNKTEDKE
jgi:branched-chain amino acid transport system substrate-binding protein